MRASRAAVSVSRACRALSCSQGSRREARQVSARVWWQVLAGWLYKYAGSIKGTMYECMLYTHGVQAPPGARVKNVVCMMPQACHCTKKVRPVCVLPILQTSQPPLFAHPLWPCWFG